MRDRAPCLTTAVAVVALITSAAFFPAASLAAGSAGNPPQAAVTAMASTVYEAAAWRLVASGDTGGLPFGIVDKQQARLSVFHANGRLAGVTRVLLGRDLGDRSMPGVGDRAQLGSLRAGDFTTPAGRFATLPGRNTQGEAVVWVDYEAAFAIHRVRPGPTLEDRLQRLGTSDSHDKRVSAGCVVVPAAFFDTVVQPVLGEGPAATYVLPEQDGWRALWRDVARRAQ